MAKTVVGLMADIHKAREAVRALIQAGVNENDIGFMANEKHVAPGDEPLAERPDAEAAHRGGIVVSVAADSEAQADRVHGILMRHGAVDVDERFAP